MFIAALFLIAKRWKQSKYPSTYEWINKMWYIHTMQYYSAMKKGYQQVSRWLSGKESACNAGDIGLILGSERFPGEGNGSPLQYFFFHLFLLVGG